MQKEDIGKIIYDSYVRFIMENDRAANGIRKNVEYVFWLSGQPSDDEFIEQSYFEVWCTRNRGGHGRSLYVGEAIEAFKDDLWAMCRDHIRSGDNVQHWKNLLQRIRNKDAIDWAEKLRMTKQIPIDSLVRRYGYNPRMGFIRCPFHGKDNTASMKLYDKTNTWKCFGCGKRGDAVDFVREQQGCSFVQAINFLI